MKIEPLQGTPSFEQLPSLVQNVLCRLDGIEKTLAKRILAQSPSDKPMNAKEAADFLLLSRSSIYRLAAQGLIKCSKQGQRLYFMKQDLLAWLKSGSRPTQVESREEAERKLLAYKLRMGYDI